MLRKLRARALVALVMGLQLGCSHPAGSIIGDWRVQEDGLTFSFSRDGTGVMVWSSGPVRVPARTEDRFLWAEAGGHLQWKFISQRVLTKSEILKVKLERVGQSTMIGHTETHTEFWPNSDTLVLDRGKLTEMTLRR